MTDTHLKSNKIMAHAWSPDFKYIAVALKNNYHIEIYEVGPNPEKITNWKKIHQFSDAQLPVPALAWSIDNKILSGSYDRSVFVYRNQNDKWSKDLVICANEKAILDGCWSPNAKKFGVSTSCHHVYIGYFDEKSKWWSSAKISAFKSSVSAIEFHKSGRVIAVGSLDYSVSIITCVIEEVINNQAKILLDYEDLTYNGVFSDINSFGEQLFVFSNDCWITSLSFSPSGSQLLAVSQNGQLVLTNIQANGEADLDNRQTIRSTKNKPFLKIKYVSDDLAIGVGFDKKPIKIDCKGQLKITGQIDNSLLGSGQGQASGISAARQMFEKQAITTTNTKNGKNDHQTAINCLNLLKNGLLSTSDVNGNINLWKI